MPDRRGTDTIVGKRRLELRNGCDAVPGRRGLSGVKAEAGNLNIET
jgi:hypothetical protein